MLTLAWGCTLNSPDCIYTRHLEGFVSSSLTTMNLITLFWLADRDHHGPIVVARNEDAEPVKDTAEVLELEPK